MSNRLHELLHGGIVFPFRILVIPVLLMDISHTSIIETLRLSEVERQRVQGAGVEHIKLHRRRPLHQSFELMDNQKINNQIDNVRSEQKHTTPLFVKT